MWRCQRFKVTGCRQKVAKFKYSNRIYQSTIEQIEKGTCFGLERPPLIPTFFWTTMHGNHSFFFSPAVKEPRNWKIEIEQQALIYLFYIASRNAETATTAGVIDCYLNSTYWWLSNHFPDFIRQPTRFCDSVAGTVSLPHKMEI